MQMFTLFYYKAFWNSEWSITIFSGQIFLKKKNDCSECCITDRSSLEDTFIQSISWYTFTFLSVLAFPGNQTHDLGVASAKAILFEQLMEDNKINLRSIFHIHLFTYLICSGTIKW